MQKFENRDENPTNRRLVKGLSVNELEFKVHFEILVGKFPINLPWNIFKFGDFFFRKNLLYNATVSSEAVVKL